MLEPEKVSQEFVFPSFWRSSGELFGLKPLLFVREGPELFRKFLGSLRVILCCWKTFPAPKHMRL